MAIAESKQLRPLQSAAFLAVLVGALGALGLLLHAAQRSNSGRPLVLSLMAIWVLAPFVALGLAAVASRGWSALTRTSLYWVMLLLSLGTLLAYGADALGPPRKKAAAIFVAVPGASWLLIVLVLSLAVFRSARRSRRE